jgi:DNA-binding IscR family transcriptional regulator
LHYDVIALRYKEGCVVNKLAEDYNVSSATIYNILKSQGVKAHRGSKFSFFPIEIRKKIIKSFREKEMIFIQELAREFQTNPKEIKKIVTIKE